MLSGAKVVAAFFSSVSFKEVPMQKHSTKPFTAITYSVLTEPVKALVLIISISFASTLGLRVQKNCDV